MNFFDDDFGLNSTPLYTRKSSNNVVPQGSFGKKAVNYDQVSRKSNKKDEFDDLMDDLLGKQQKRNVKKKQREQIQPYSSTFLQPSHNNGMDFKKTEKWSTPNIGFDSLMQSPKFPNNKNYSNVDDKNSEDNRSYKSGATGRQNKLQFDNLITMRGDVKEEIPALQRSSRNMMKPPLRKRDSKQNLNAQKQQKQTSIWDEQPNFNFSRKLIEQGQNLEINSNIEIRGRNRDDKTIKSSSPEQKFRNDENKVKEKIIQRQKIVTIREEATQLRKQFELEVKEIKESYQRQLKLSSDKLTSQIQDNKQNKHKLLKQHQLKVQEQRIRWQKLMNQNMERLKDIHEWEMKKKCQAYQMEIDKLKSISNIEDNLLKSQNRYQKDHQNIEIRSKERELQAEKHKLQQLKNYVQKRQKNIQFEERQFNNYRKRQEEKLQIEKRAILERQNQVKKLELQNRKVLATQRQKIASEMANYQLQVLRKQQEINLEKQQVRMIRELAQKQKCEFAQFNRNILAEYKYKLKEAEIQKEKLGEMEIQVHKKLHTLEMTGAQMRTAKESKDNLNRSMSRPSTNQENQRGRTNTQLEDRVMSTKERFRDMENLARKITVEIEPEREKMRGKVDLSTYINRVNRTLSKY